MGALQRLLRSIFQTRVTFPDDSYIEYHNREAILYVEPRVAEMEISWTFRSGWAGGRTLHVSSIRQWNPPDQDEPVSPQKREEVLGKIREYCRRRRIRLDIMR